MSNLIDKDVAMAEYTKLMCELVKSTNNPNISYEALSALAGYNVIRNALTIDTPSGQWISVYDKLPEIGEDVLVFAKGKIDSFVGKHVIQITRMSDVNRFWTTLKTKPYWVDPFQFFSTDYEITHWQYLPEAPKEIEDAES